MPKHRATPIMIPKTLPPKYQHPPAKAAATTTTTVQRRPVPSTGLTSSMLRDDSKNRKDEDLRHLGKLFYGPTCRFENNKLTLDHYNNVREVAQNVHSEQQDIQAKSRGISDEQINDLAKSSEIPQDDVRAIADWTVQMLKEDLTKRGAKCSSDAKQIKLLNMMIHALTLERQSTGRQFRSSGDMIIDPRSSGAMSVDSSMF